MGKVFNVTADCKPKLHYMVDISSRLEQIEGYVDRGEYFVINRARQYGKTTTLRALKEYLKEKYYVISMDFQMQMSYSKFSSENTFSVAFARAFIRIIKKLSGQFPDGMDKAVESLGKAVSENREELELVELFQYLSDICREADKPLVLMIDEIDSAANNQVFLDFLAQLMLERFVEHFNDLDCPDSLPKRKGYSRQARAVRYEKNMYNMPSGQGEKGDSFG